MESSSRRHERRGAWRTSIQNGLFILLYYGGCSPHRLHRWYYRERSAHPNEREVKCVAPAAEEPHPFEVKAEGREELLEVPLDNPAEGSLG